MNRDNLGFLLAKASQRWNDLLYERFVAEGFPEVRPSYGSVLIPLFEEDGEYRVVNNLGEFVFEIHADERTGVIDMYAGPSREQLAIFPTRVVGLPDGSTSYSFTMFQGPGMPDELFESQHASLERELANLPRVFAT